MTAAEEEFYTPERWENWLSRIREEDIDPEDEDAARLLLNLQDDTTIAVVKILEAYDEERIGDEETLAELEEVREIVLEEVDFEDEDKAILVDGVQTSLLCVFLAAEEYVVNGPESNESIADCIETAQAAEAEDDLDNALWHCARAGTAILDGEHLDRAIGEEMEYSLVAEWINGLDSLASAVSDPEVVEE